MYRNCIFCSAELGSNESVETFPVGGQLAFDGWRGRLWVVCPLCARWNLSPIEERWEAVEEAEKLFRDARLRVQSENVGLAKLGDGTRLIRIGKAVPGELAAWRYGAQLLQRRKRYFVLGGLSAVAAVGFWGGVSMAGGGFMSIWLSSQFVQNRINRKVIYRVPQALDRVDRPGRAPVVVRRWHLPGIHLDSTAAGGLEVHVRDAHRKDPGWGGEVKRNSSDIEVISGEHAHAVLARAMVHVNRAGATTAKLSDANRILADAGSADRVLREAATGGAALGKRAGRDPRVLKGPGALAFEMALNETAERAALEGELKALERAWREAEEIAAIADALPGEVMLNRVLTRFRL